MLVYLIFLVDIIYKIKKYNVPFGMVKLLLIVFLLSLLVSFYMFFAAKDIDIGTSGSDSLFYYNTALEIVNNPGSLFGYFAQHSGGYIALISVTLLTMPIDSSYVLIMLNMVIFIDLILTLYLYLLKKKIQEAQYIVIILALSGGLMLVSVQILKDIFLFFIFIEILFLNIVKPSFFKTILFLIIASSIRPYIWIIITPLLLLDFKINREFFKNNYIKPLISKFYLILFAIALVILYFIFQDVIELSIKIANQTAISNMKSYESLVSGDFLINLPLYFKLPISVSKFVLLPLPFASLQADHSNFIIKLLYFSQSILFHVFLFYIIIHFRRVRYTGRKLLPLILFALSYIMVYSIIYLGNADMRIRLPMIVIVTILGVIAIKNVSKDKNNAYLYGALLTAYLSVPSLYKYLEYFETIKIIIIFSISFFIIYFFTQKFINYWKEK
jgi:hypothetical protein